MAILNEKTKEIILKAIIVGCRGSGKTTNMQSLFKQTSQEMNSRLFDLHDLPKETTQYEFLPFAAGTFKEHNIKVNLYTCPTHSIWPTANEILFRGVDVILFVIDSRAQALLENESTLQKCRDTFESMGLNWDQTPKVFQLNHRDAVDALPLSALKAEFGAGACTEAVAVQDIGTLESMELMCDFALARMGQLSNNTASNSSVQ